MGLSLSVLVALCFLLPGVTFTLGIRRLHNPSAPPTLLEQHVSLGLAIAFLAALLLQGVWYALWRCLLALGNWPLPDAAQFIALLGGSLDKVPAASEALTSIRDYPLRISAYFTTIGILPFFLGRLVNKRIRVRTADWSELLKPKGPDFVLLTMDVCFDGGCSLIAGPVETFSLDKSGALDRVVLRSAAKKQIKDGTAVGEWKPVPGEFIVVQLKDTKTINLDYIYVDDDQESDGDTSGSPAAQSEQSDPSTK